MDEKKTPIPTAAPLSDEELEGAAGGTALCCKICGERLFLWDEEIVRMCLGCISDQQSKKKKRTYT